MGSAGRKVNKTNTKTVPNKEPVPQNLLDELNFTRYADITAENVG